MTYDVWYRVRGVQSRHLTTVPWHPLSRNEVIQVAIAKACAREFHNHADAKIPDPITLDVFWENDDLLFSAVVRMEMVPEFTAQLLETGKPIVDFSVDEPEGDR